MPEQRMTDAEMDRWIAARVFAWGADGYTWVSGESVGPRPFSTDLNAAHAAWLKLTPEQKDRTTYLATGHLSVHRTAHRKLLDADARTLCDWIYEALKEE